MSQSQAIRLGVEPVRSSAFGDITADYTGIGTEINNPVRILRIQNLTNALLWFSYDGVNNHEALSPNSFLLLDITSNAARDHGYYIAEGTRLYVKRNETPTSGSVYVTVYYGSIE